MTIRRIINAPLRFFRYLTEPGVEMKARFDALPEKEKTELRYQALKRDGAYRMFPSPFGGKRTKDRP